jgi:hypothetical protein
MKPHHRELVKKKILNVTERYSTAADSNKKR